MVCHSASSAVGGLFDRGGKALLPSAPELLQESAAGRRAGLVVAVSMAAAASM